MADPTDLERIEAALLTSAPCESLHELAKQFKAEGMSQNAMLQLFDHIRAMHQDDPDEMKLNTVRDTMDFIFGFCSAPMRIFADRDLGSKDADPIV